MDLHKRLLHLYLMIAGTILLCSTAVSPTVAPKYFLSRGTLLQTTTKTVDTFTWCGEGKCRCKGTYADCSNHGANLTYVPKLPPEIRFLNFTYNRALIDQDNFFSNVTNIDHLELGNNQLQYISPGAFQIFHQLSVLNLGFNNLTYVTLAPALTVKTLKLLNIVGVKLGPVSNDLFDRHQLPRLQSLVMYKNRMLRLNMSVFVPLKELIDLNVDSNEISELETDCLPNLKYLGLADNRLSNFPASCKGRTSLLPLLETLNLRQNTISTLPDSVCLPSLHALDLSSNRFSELVSGMFGEQRFPLLHTLLLKTTHVHLKRVESSAFNNSCIKRIDLYGNQIDFSSPTVDSDLFAGCSSLTGVYLAHNSFRGVSADRFRSLFCPLPQLVYLNLGSCSVRHIDANFFLENKELEKLHLTSNLISSIPDGTFDLLPKLTHLQLGNNLIETVQGTTFSLTTRKRLRSLNLSKNPFRCDCDLLWFRRWYMSNYSLFHFYGPNPYTCYNLLNTTLSAFNMTDQVCLFSHETYVFLVVILSLVMSIVLFVVALHRYRWHIRLLLYEAFHRRHDTQRLQTEHYLFDIFVSYAEEDSHWVFGQLKVQLEDRRGLRLCLHKRDFHPGKHIVDNIVHCVERSKKVLMVFSSNFAHSPWCQFELTLCLTHVMDQGDVLVVVCLHHIPSRDLTPAMMAVMKTTTYISWADEPDAVRAFWGRLAIAFSEVMPVR